jgi:hypothetical protein
MGSSASRRPHHRIIRTRRARRVAVCVAVITVLFLVLAATALAYVPGQRIWVRTIGTAAKQAAAWDVATGPNGVVCIGGWRGAPWPAPFGRVGLVVKYNAAGTRKWTKTYAGLGNAEVVAVAFDGKGNICVAGHTWATAGGGADIFVAKYSPRGVRRWVASYGAGNNVDDWAEAIAVDQSGNVYVGGSGGVGNGLYGVVVVKYGAGGKEMWLAPARLDPDPAVPDQGSREPTGIGIDAAGNVYVAGVARDGGAPDYLQYSALVFKVATSNGTIAWGPKYWKGKDGSGAGAYGIAVRGRAVVVCGEASKWTSWHNDLLVLRYDRAGNQKHPPLEYDRSATTDDSGEDVAIDARGNAYVTGDFTVQPVGHPSSCAVVKVSPAGKVRWARAYRPRGKYAVGWSVGVDAANNAYVAGAVEVSPSYDKLLVMKYSASGQRKWVRTWPAAANGYNDPDGGLALGANGVLYVAGHGQPSGPFYKAVLIKYQR